MAELSKTQQALAQLEEGLERITSSEDFQQWLKSLSYFHQYSWGNTLLIWMQNKNATQVAGFQTWAKMNRFVRKGEKGIRILAPRTITKEENGKEYTEVIGFRPVYVFDVSQTEGEDLPVGPRETLVPGSSQAAEHLLNLSQCTLKAHGVSYRRDQTSPALGYYSRQRKEIVVDESLEPIMEARILAHEMVHFFAHSDLAPGEYQRDRSEIESVTESVAYVVLHHFNLDPGDSSFHYVASWARDPEVIKQRLGEIQRLSSRVIGELEKRVEVDEECIASESTHLSPVAA